QITQISTTCRFGKYTRWRMESEIEWFIFQAPGVADLKTVSAALVYAASFPGSLCGDTSSLCGYSGCGCTGRSGWSAASSDTSDGRRFQRLIRVGYLLDALLRSLCESCCGSPACPGFPAPTCPGSAPNSSGRASLSRRFASHNNSPIPSRSPANL